jgi:hypothetical protein
MSRGGESMSPPHAGCLRIGIAERAHTLSVRSVLPMSIQLIGGAMDGQLLGHCSPTADRLSSLSDIQASVRAAGRMRGASTNLLPQSSLETVRTHREIVG